MIKMYSDDITNFVVKMVEKLRSEDETLFILNAAKRISFLTDIGVRTYYKIDFKHVYRCQEQFNQSPTKRETYQSRKFIILIKTLCRAQLKVCLPRNNLSLT